MPKPAQTAHQTELRAKLHNRCDAVKRQNQTRNMLYSGGGFEVDMEDVPINCQSAGHNRHVTLIKFLKKIKSGETSLEFIKI